MSAARNYAESLSGTAEGVKFNARGRIWTREENGRIAALYRDGVRPTEIAKMFGVSRLSIESKLQYWGIRQPRNLWKERELQRAVCLQRAGMTQAEIGRVLDRSEISVGKALRRARSAQA